MCIYIYIETENVKHVSLVTELFYLFLQPQIFEFQLSNGYFQQDFIVRSTIYPGSIIIDPKRKQKILNWSITVFPHVTYKFYQIRLSSSIYMFNHFNPCSWQLTNIAISKGKYVAKGEENERKQLFLMRKNSTTRRSLLQVVHCSYYDSSTCRCKLNYNTEEMLKIITPIFWLMNKNYFVRLLRMLLS